MFINCTSTKSTDWEDDKFVNATSLSKDGDVIDLDHKPSIEELDDFTRRTTAPIVIGIDDDPERSIMTWNNCDIVIPSGSDWVPA